MPYTSPTEQLQSPHAHTFTGIALDAQGNAYTSERKGLRKTKKKGFVVRYANPFAGGGGHEILLEASAALDHLWRSPSGSLHAVGKRYHFETDGKWRSANLGKGNIYRVFGASDADVWLTCFFDAQYGLYRGSGKTFERCAWMAEANVIDLLPTAQNQVLLATAEGLARFDGEALHPLSDTMTAGRLHAAKDGAIYTTASDGDILLSRMDGQRIDALVRRSDVELETGDRFSSVTEALGDLHAIVSHGHQRGLYRINGASIEHLVRATGYCDVLAGNDEVLWMSNGIELLVTDGKEWRSVPRAMHVAA